MLPGFCRADGLKNILEQHILYTHMQHTAFLQILNTSAI